MHRHTSGRAHPRPIGQGARLPYQRARAAVRVLRGTSVLSAAWSLRPVGGGAETAHAVRRHYGGHDRVVIVTDEQAWYSDPTAEVPSSVPVYTFNVAGYARGHAVSGVANRYTFGGLTDHGFAAIPLLENGRDEQWPFGAADGARRGSREVPPYLSPVSPNGQGSGLRSRPVQVRLLPRGHRSFTRIRCSPDRVLPNTAVPGELLRHRRTTSRRWSAGRRGARLH